MEEACSESSRKMKDIEETTSEASWTTVTKRERKRGCGGWNRNQTRMEKTIKGKAPWDEGAEVQSPEKKSDSGGI